MKFPRLLASAALLALLALTTGCGDDKPKESQRVRVSGKVTLDGNPLKTGKISFDLNNGEPPAVLDILDGAYEGKVQIGKNKVQLMATKKISMREKMKMDGPGYDTLVDVNLLPERYNVKSEIVREVDATGENTFNFELKSS